MNVELWYEKDVYYEPQEVSLLYENGETKQMDRQGERFYCELDLPPGEYRYRFLIDGELELVDPHNNLLEPDEEGVLWSLVIINPAGKRLYNPDNYSLELTEYGLCHHVSETAPSVQKKTFFREKDKQAVARLVFCHITGLHLLTAAWYTPEGELYQYAENELYEEKEEAVTLWFWLNLSETGMEQQGMWTLRIFLDGQFLLGDLFTVCSLQEQVLYQQI